MTITDSSTLTPVAEPDTSVYAILVTNTETRVLDVKPDRPILDQIRDAPADALPEMVFPPLRDIEVYSCARWASTAPMVAVTLEHGLSMEDLQVNWKAWAAYGRSPIVGPTVLIHDSDQAGMPVPIPPDVVSDVLAPVPDQLIGRMLQVLDSPEYHLWADRHDGAR